MSDKTEFQAYAKGDHAYGDTPRQAAENFFNKHSSRRKCDIIEGVNDGYFFRGSYNKDKMPRSYKEITKKQIQDLPNV